MGSFVLGIISWIIPVIAIIRRNNGCKFNNFSLLSLSSCAIALLFQIFEIKHRVNIEDWSAIVDTIGAISVAAIILIVVTVLLNALATRIGKHDSNV